jgi:pilus assembly protein CpaE
VTPRILVVTDDASLQALIGQALAGSGMELLLATGGGDAMRRWQTDRPALMVIDMNVAGMDGASLAERVRGADPAGQRTPMVLIGGADPRVKLRALQAGADDYLAVPVHPAELAARVRRLLARALPGIVAPTAAAAASSAAAPAPAVQGPALGQVLAFYGAKGGVGTTTIAVNAAIALHKQQRRRVALVDANLQFGDHRVFLDVGLDKRSIVDAAESPSIDMELLASILVHHGSGIDLLLAPPTPETADLVSAERHHLLQVVEVLRSMYDYVVLDLDQRLDDHALDVLGVADRVLVVLNADLSCIKNVRLVMETLRQVGVPQDHMTLVMNRSNAMTGVSVKSVESVLKCEIEHMIVNDYRAAITGLNTGRPFQAGRVEAGIGASIAELVRRLDGAVREAHVPARPVSQPQPQGLRALTAGGKG